MKKLPLLCLFTALTLLVRVSSGADVAQMEPIGKALMQFPQMPSEKAFRSVERMMAAVSPTDHGEDKRHVRLLCAVFLARASEHHGWPLTGKGRSGQDARAILAGQGELAAYVSDDRVVDPAKLDVWWVGYFGSQDDAYLDKLLKYAGGAPPLFNREKAAVVRVATWSFKSNCQQIKGVREYARRRLGDPAYQAKRSFLQGCLSPSS